MLRRRLGWLVMLCLGGCTSSRTTPNETPVVALDTPNTKAPPPPAPSASAATPVTSVSVPVASASASMFVATPNPSTSANAGPPTAYPEAWISSAQRENVGLSCFELVYKNGCSQTRTGVVTMKVTIDDNGAVEKFSEVDNQIHHDKAVVSRCIKKNMPKWKFHPPEGHLKTFEVRVILADRC